MLARSAHTASDGHAESRRCWSSSCLRRVWRLPRSLPRSMPGADVAVDAHGDQEADVVEALLNGLGRHAEREGDRWRDVPKVMAAVGWCSAHGATAIPDRSGTRLGAQGRACVVTGDHRSTRRFRPRSCRHRCVRRLATVCASMAMLCGQSVLTVPKPGRGPAEHRSLPYGGSWPLCGPIRLAQSGIPRTAARTVNCRSIASHRPSW